MDPISRVDELLLQWQEQRQQGRRPSLEAICRDCPELLAALQQRVAALASMEAFLQLAPPSQPSTHDYRSLASTSDGLVAAPPGKAVSASLAQRGRFTIVKPHAKGGLGQVSIARDEKLRRQVALKEIRAEYPETTVAPAPPVFSQAGRLCHLVFG